MAVKRNELTKAEVKHLINQLVAEEMISNEILFTFAEKINGRPFKAPKPTPITMAAAKKAVLSKFDCKTVTELRKNKTFLMSMTGETIALKTKADWMKLYRTWIEVPVSERNQKGPTCINGIDVLENFRPWHVFGLDSSKATKEDVAKAFRNLAKTYHPDSGGDRRVFERLKEMKETALDRIDLRMRTSR